MKGFGVVAIALVGAVAFLLFTGLVLNVLIGSSVTFRTVAKESEVIKAVNGIEAIKRGMPYALYYSYLETLQRSGYMTYLEVRDKTSFEKNLSTVFGEYRVKLRELSGIVIPAGNVSVKLVGKELLISFTSSGFLTYAYESKELMFQLVEDPNMTIRVANNQLVEVW